MELLLYFACALLGIIAVFAGIYLAFWRAKRNMDKEEYLSSEGAEQRRIQKSYEERNNIESAVTAESKARNISPDIVIEELRHESNDAYTFLKDENLNE